MGHFRYALERPVLTRNSEESLLAVSKAFGGQAKSSCAFAHEIRDSVAGIASADQLLAIFWKGDCYCL
jgi:hypothetical protein